MGLEEDTLYEKAQDSAEHYNQMIWTVFSVGIALSLFILYTTWMNWRNEILGNRPLIRLFMIVFGYSVFIYCTFTLKDFEKKKEKLHNFQNKIYKEHPLKGYKQDQIGTFFYQFSLFLINFAYIYAFLTLPLQYFSISLTRLQLALSSLTLSLIPTILYVWRKQEYKITS